MLLAEQFQENAEKCLQMADRAGDPLTKAAWERLAETWRELELEEAEHFERLSSRVAAWRQSAQ
jgi:hypothetical protein